MRAHALRPVDIALRKWAGLWDGGFLFGFGFRGVGGFTKGKLSKRGLTPYSRNRNNIYFEINIFEWYYIIIGFLRTI